MKTDRENNINSFVDSIMTDKQWNDKRMNLINDMMKKFSVELEKYNYIAASDLNKMKLGGYVRYINFNNEIRWGGILIKIYTVDDLNYMTLLSSSMKRFNICFERNYIFYKKHTTSSDKMRELFISYLTKEDYAED